MKNKQSALIQTSKMPLTMGLAFVAFTTQFGGCFASGAQIYQYFINYGLWCLLLPLVTQGLYAFFFWYGMRYSYRHKVYDYRAVSNSMYGKFKPLMSNLYELCYLIMIGTASAAAFATGGSTLNTLLGIPYWLCTFFVATFIFVIALFGTKLVRKAASTLSVCILVGLLLVLLPNILVQFSTIIYNISLMAGGQVSVLASKTPSFLGALWMAILYFFFQLPSVSVMYQHMEDVRSVKEINRAVILIFVCTFFAMELSIFGLLAVAFVPTLKDASVPMLVMVQNGVGSLLLTPIISILIILGSISTAVNMISGIVTRCVNQMEHGKKVSEDTHLVHNAIFTLLFTFIAFAIAQFGLMAVVVKGYAYLGYAGLITLFIPMLVRLIRYRCKDI